jgi:lipopolysaccharide export system permease protein
VLGLALAVVNPRAGRSGSLVFALFAFVVYYNLMTVGQSWIAAGRLGLPSFMLTLHGGTLLLGLLLLAARHNHWSPRMPWRGRSAA